MDARATNPANMAANLHSHSPRVSALDPVTPVHSPHHSVHSSTSSRTPLHTLTLHEYRKQQNSPASQSATPPGKTLRRKAAASGLNEVERVSPRAPLRPLHFSQSTHQSPSRQVPLPPPPPPPPPPPFSQQPFRSQSTEPHHPGGASLRGFTSDSVGKTREFKPIKRLPKPPVANGLGLPALASVTPAHQRLSPLRTALFPSVENSSPSDSQSTPSTLSLSQFAQPPHSVGHSISPPNDENVPPRLNTASFTTTAPATPPATPAVIRYHGASFDLVNPHDSLYFHEVVTPLRDLDSTEYLPLQSSEEPIAFSEMAPKRALYGDLSSAYTSIIARRNDDHHPPSTPNLDLPPPPTSVFWSSGSSEYTSPLYSPDSDLAVSPLKITKRENESRFSLKQLTRTLAKKLGKPTEIVQDEELRDLTGSRVSLASASFDGGFPRPLDQSYPLVTPKSASFPDDPPTPVSPLDHAINSMSHRSSERSIEQPMFTTQRYSSAPLTSMLPDDASSQVERPSDPGPSLSEGDMLSRPYYDDLPSIYRSSSIYTGDEHTRSTYAPSQMTVRNSNAFAHMSGDASTLAREQTSEALYDYSAPRRTSRPISRPLTQEIFQRSLQQDNDKTDISSKFIDQCERLDSRNASQPVLSERGIGNAELVSSPSSALEDPVRNEPAEEPRVSSGLSQFEFDLPETTNSGQSEEAMVPSVEVEHVGKPAIDEQVSLPPHMPAPLAPAFEYNEDYQATQFPHSSEIFSEASSYGDTIQLLQLPQSEVGDVQEQALELSSPYSQPEASVSRVPEEALDQAGEIFENVQAEQQNESIPAMWTQRNSGNLLRDKRGVDKTSQKVHEEQGTPVAEDDAERGVGDWETVENNSQGGQLSPGESLADYSDFDEEDDRLGFSSSLPVQEDSTLEPDSLRYQQPSPLGAHTHPFNSSPPQLGSSLGVRSVAPGDAFFSSPASNPPALTAAPAFLKTHDHVESHISSPQQHPPFASWSYPFALSDKETQELLASGPNNEILYEPDPLQIQDQGSEHSKEAENKASPYHSVHVQPPTSSSMDSRYDGPTSERLEYQNSFETSSMLGPNGNIIGTPRGTGMHEVGNSEADNSDPGIEFGSRPYDRAQQTRAIASYTEPNQLSTVRCDIPEFVSSSDRDSNANRPSFYATPGRTASVHRVDPRPNSPDLSEETHERTPSLVTLFPRPIPESPFAGSSRRSSRHSPHHSLRWPSSVHRPRGHSRASVPGQTKLRQMVLAPDAETLSSSNSTRMSRFLGTANSERPSSANTHLPLKINASEAALQAVMAKEHSPHLLCPERAVGEEQEAEQRKISWAIFAVFCILPPMLILYRSMADFVIVNVTKGRIFHAHPKPKRIALPVGIAVNLGISGAILVPVLIAHATGAL